MPHHQNPPDTSENPGRRAILLADTSHSEPLEIELLIRGLGIRVVAHKPRPKAGLPTANYVGDGKLKELAALTGGPGVAKRFPKKEAEEEDPGDPEIQAESEEPPAPIADLLIVDDELTPGQERNLGRALDVEIWDRPRVILKIFQARAQTREAKLGVELARLKYELPRLRDDQALIDREGGGGGRGERGHTNVELAKERSIERIHVIERELAAVSAVARTQRERRTDALGVALVGYTNAGKSSLMRALSGSNVLVADKLFATLGTTTRQLSPPTTPPILITDTVGFISRLPHALVASFRSTLDEVNEATLLGYVVDASNPDFRQQHEVTRRVIEEVGAGDLPQLLLLNKVDRLGAAEHERLALEFPDALLISAHDPADVARVHRSFVDFFDQRLVTAEVEFPYSKAGVFAELRGQVRVLREDFDSAQRVLVRGLPEVIARLKHRLGDDACARRAAPAPIPLEGGTRSRRKQAR